MSKLLSLALVILVLCEGAFSAEVESSTEANLILKAADEIRNPGASYTMDVKVSSEGKEQELVVHLKGRDKTLIVTKLPKKDRGRNMLMLDRDFRVFIPNIKRSVRLSLSQKLAGDVANGDIARTRWFGDYEATIVSKDGKEIELMLTAKTKNLTYNKMRLWVRSSDSRPLRAQYLSVDGKTLLKSARFSGYKLMAGKERPSAIEIENPNGKKSQILIQKMSQKNHENSFFSEINLKRLR